MSGTSAGVRLPSGLAALGSRSRLDRASCRQGSNAGGGDCKERDGARSRCVLRLAVVGVQIALLVLDRSPQPLDEHIVPPRALAVHADLDVALMQNIRKRVTAELRALV